VGMTSIFGHEPIIAHPSPRVSPDRAESVEPSWP
jgi:hypothetical protein